MTIIGAEQDLTATRLSGHTTERRSGSGLRNPLSVLLGLGWLQRHRLLPAIGAAAVRTIEIGTP